MNITEIEETRRRQRATVTGGESTLNDTSGYTRAFQTDDQKYVLWNFANTNLCPRSPFPAVRLIGLFPDVDSARLHATQNLDNSCSIRVATTHEWYTIPEQEHEVEAAKVNRNLLKHQNMLQDHALEFKNRHDALTAGRKPAIEHARQAQEQASRNQILSEKRREYYQAAVENAENIEELKQDMNRAMEVEALQEVELQRKLQLILEAKQEISVESKAVEYHETPLKAPRPPEMLNANWQTRVQELSGGKNNPGVPGIPRNAEIRNQRYAVVSVLTDYETASDDLPLGNEPAVIVWAAFESEAEALQYNKCVAAKYVHDHDLAIVNMYEWLYPHMMLSDEVDQLYRNEELNNIMRTQRTASKKVKTFEQECDTEGITVPSHAIEPDLKTPAPIKWVAPIGSELD